MARALNGVPSVSLGAIRSPPDVPRHSCCPSKCPSARYPVPRSFVSLRSPCPSLVPGVSLCVPAESLWIEFWFPCRVPHVDHCPCWVSLDSIMCPLSFPPVYSCPLPMTSSSRDLNTRVLRIRIHSWVSELSLSVQTNCLYTVTTLWFSETIAQWIYMKESSLSSRYFMHANRWWDSIGAGTRGGTGGTCSPLKLPKGAQGGMHVTNTHGVLNDNMWWPCMLASKRASWLACAAPGAVSFSEYCYFVHELITSPAWEKYQCPPNIVYFPLPMDRWV